MNGSSGDRHVAFYAVLVDGQTLDQETSRRIREVRVLNYLRLPDVCTFTAIFGKGGNGQREPIDQHPFEIGRSLEIRLGQRDALTTTTLFKGEIVTLEPHFSAGSVELTVRGFDRSHVLLRSRRVRTFQNQTTSDIVGKIVREAGFDARCEPSGEPHEFLQQNNETDWDFIWRLADRIGFEFVVEGRTARFRKPTAASAVELEWPTALRSFSPRLTAVQQVHEVSLLAQDPRSKQAIDVTVSSAERTTEIGIARDSVAAAFAGAKAHICTEPVKSQAEGRAVAQALLNRLADAYITAEGVTDGNPKIRAGATVAVRGVGQKFSGTYRVSSAAHVLRGGSTYETRFTNSPQHTFHGASGRSRGATSEAGFGSHLVLGIVTNNADPSNLGRVRVRYPALGANAEGAWARIATLSAGKERGALMLPVVGEEVLVGFEHDDTTRPYVLGSLFNGHDTPGGDLLNGQDGSFGLKSDKGFRTESKGDYKIKSGGKVIVEAGDNVQQDYKKDWIGRISGKASLSAAQSFEIQGQTVTVTGQTEVKLEGSATVTLKCGATQIQLSSAGVQISGPMIQLG